MTISVWMSIRFRMTMTVMMIITVCVSLRLAGHQAPPYPPRCKALWHMAPASSKAPVVVVCLRMG